DSFGSSLRDGESHLAKLKESKDKLYKEMPQTMVMEEMPEPRKTFILVRGDWRNHGEQVTPAVPAIFAAGDVTNRLALAKWLVSTNQPLTPRVTVNRYW